MARTPRDARIETRKARLKLQERHDPHWRQVVPGLFIGYRRANARSNGVWYSRKLEAGRYRKKRVGQADDHIDADGKVTLTYTQAVDRVREVAAGKSVSAPRHYGDGVVLNDVIDAYLSARQTIPGGRQNRVMSEGNAKLTRQSWDRYGATIGQMPVTAIDTKTLQTWHAGIAKAPPTKRGKVMSFNPREPQQLRGRKATANRVLTTVKAALRWAQVEGLLSDAHPDYWARVKPFAIDEDPLPRMLEPDEVSRLLKSAAPELRELLTGAMMTGARYGDLCALKVGDFNVEGGVVRIQQGKTGKLLWQPLTPEGKKFFERISVGREQNEPMFRREDGRPWRKSEAARPMHEAAQTSKLQGVTFKAMRSTYGKLLLLATRDIELVAKALGHSDSRITRRHYAHLLPSEVARGIAKLPALGIDE
ncbi:tyrosine-type recombinase/integrase [Sinimarinibacterium flocculans]|uniref:Site-specific recombinase XerD n=1 Tax=Sinimarinibacterium flocculans TaxID=985250 RepID=A0A318EHZ1_9GAMM|nr:tyrosine-type recombinase/integrase [Sinimarinibacterium flocculans]PXV71550.1 site-specific recombinase XerD [Sinimarinibacterium flocculans]